jgi:hypothetical protein
MDTQEDQDNEGCGTSLTLGVFVATPVDPSGRDFTIVTSTLDEPASMLRQMAAKTVAETTDLLAKSGTVEDDSRAYEISLDLPGGYHGFAVTCTGPNHQKLILIVAAKAPSLALFKMAMEASKAKAYKIVEALARQGGVSRDLMRDLHFSIERELDSFRL